MGIVQVIKAEITEFHMISMKIKRQQRLQYSLIIRYCVNDDRLNFPFWWYQGVRRRLNLSVSVILAIWDSCFLNKMVGSRWSKPILSLAKDYSYSSIIISTSKLKNCRILSVSWYAHVVRISLEIKVIGLEFKS